MAGLVQFLLARGQLKFSVMAVFMITIAGALAGCNSSGGSGSGEPEDQDTQLRILANVVDDEGFVLPGATVRFETDADDVRLITDDRGQVVYTHTFKSPGDRSFTVSAKADGHLAQLRSPSVPEGASRVRLDFALKALPGVDRQAGAESGFGYTGSDGTNVAIAPGTLTDATGAPVVGEIGIQLGSLALDDPRSRAAFPGLFTGEDDRSRPVRIAALAVANFRFTQAGEPLALSPGQSATVVLPLTANRGVGGQPLAVGQVVPLWSMNASSGLWQQESDGTVINWVRAPAGLAIQGTVSHFSWWLAAEPLSTVPASVLMACPGPDDTCRNAGLGGHVDFEAASDDGPWYSQRIDLPGSGSDKAVTAELPTLPAWLYGFDSIGRYGGTSPEALGSGGAYPPQVPLTPQADEAISINLEPLHEILSDWPEARGRSALTGLLSGPGEAHDYLLNLKPNDDLLLRVMPVDPLDFDSDSQVSGAGIDVMVKDPNDIVLFHKTLDSGGPLTHTVSADTGGDYSVTITENTNEQVGYTANTAVQRGPRVIAAQCEPYDPEPDSGGGGGVWTAPGDAKESSFSIPASQRGGGIITATLSAGHKSIDPRLKVCVDSACTAGTIVGDTGIDSPAAKVKFEARVGVGYTFHIEQFGNAPEPDYPVGYTLNIDFSPRVDCWEPNDTRMTARDIELDKIIKAYMLAGFESNNIASSEFVDWYAVDFRHTGTLVARFNPPAGNHLMRVQLEDELGDSVLLENLQETAGTAFTANTVRPVEPGIYYLRVGVLVGDDGKAEGNSAPPAHWDQEYALKVSRR